MTWENVHDILLRQQHEVFSEKKNTEINICLEKDKKNKHVILIVKQIVVVILFLLGILKNFHNGHIFLYKKYILKDEE